MFSQVILWNIFYEQFVTSLLKAFDVVTCFPQKLSVRVNHGLHEPFCIISTVYGPLDYWQLWYFLLCLSDFYLDSMPWSVFHRIAYWYEAYAIFLKMLWKFDLSKLKISGISWMMFSFSWLIIFDLSNLFNTMFS